jgi:hypothetical protein
MMRRMPTRWFAVPSLLLAAAAFGQQPLQRFENRNGTFHIGLPAGWRQVAPNEARRIGELAAAPEPLRLAQPQSFYAVGRVERWLAGDFTEPWLYVVEKQTEWYVSDDFAGELTTMWATQGAATGERHELAGIRKQPVGEQQVEVVTATRTTTPPGGRPTYRCLDVYAPAGSSQITLSFCCAPEQFTALEPEFRRWLGTLTFARVRKGQASLGDRLWSPILTGGAVGLILLLLWRHTRSRR